MQIVSSLMSVMKEERRSDVTWVPNSLLKHSTQLLCGIAFDDRVGTRGRRELADSADRLVTRGYDRPDRSPLSPVVRRSKGGHNTYTQGRVTFWLGLWTC